MRKHPYPSPARAQAWRLVGDALWTLGDLIGAIGYRCYIRAQKAEKTR